MKKFIVFFMTTAMLFALSACSSNSSSRENLETDSIPEISSESTLPEETTAVMQEETGNGSTDENGNVLVAYFSYSGNTEQVANEIHTLVGGDIIKIEPVTPYPDDLDTVVDQGQQEQNEEYHPPVSTTIDNWDDYDTVLIGSDLVV
ncbi:hypothetical protein C808_03194 [Lachnospiraceae bacterium M18-1]|nr:hypothetical protein C808_03194 [Lachnospiraceae bacterium M18-1]